MPAPLASLLAAVSCALITSAACAQDSPLRVFDTGELTLDRYTVIERLWTGTLRASFRIPTHDDPAAAIAALTSKAADLGADGVDNLPGVNNAGGWGGGYYCYGLAIKLK